MALTNKGRRRCVLFFMRVNSNSVIIFSEVGGHIRSVLGRIIRDSSLLSLLWTPIQENANLALSCASDCISFVWLSQPFIVSNDRSLVQCLRAAPVIVVAGPEAKPHTCLSQLCFDIACVHPW